MHIGQVHNIPGDKSPQYAQRLAKGRMATARRLQRPEKPCRGPFRFISAVLVGPLCHLPTFWCTWVIYPPGIWCTLVKCTISRGINHPSTPKGRQMAHWPTPRQLQRPQKPCRGPFRSFSAVLLAPLWHLPTFWLTGVIYPLESRALYHCVAHCPPLFTVGVPVATH